MANENTNNNTPPTNTPTRTHTPLPVIVGKAYTPKRNIKSWQEEITCENQECKSPCFCAAVQGPHTKAHIEHTHYKTIDPPANGTGWLERKASGKIVYHAPWLRKPAPFKMHAVKARVETSAKALARMRKECETPKTCVKLLVNSDGNGYAVTATNGYWALLERGETTQGRHALDFLRPGKGYRAVVLNDHELWCALQRAAIMSSKKSKSVTMVLEENTCTLYSYDSDAGECVGECVDTVGAEVRAGMSFACRLNWTYLEHVLGAWPLTMYVKDEESSVMFEPEDKAWRFVLMPLLGDVQKDADYVRKVKAEMNAPKWVWNREVTK